MKKKTLQQAVNSIEFFLNPRLLSPDHIRRISKHLSKGDLIVMHEAFEESFAERMWRCLDQYSSWKLYESYEEHFHYHHHNIYDETMFPEDLMWCRDLFGSTPSLSFVQQLSGRDCSGKPTFSASLYLPGDHSLPHNDLIVHDGQQRQVAFVWNLTKHWQADGGGEFFWCKKGKSIAPAFNTLFLFNVGYNSMHFVTLVSPHAQGKRLAISGWWMGPSQIESGSAKLSSRGPNKKDLLEII